MPPNDSSSSSSNGSNIPRKKDSDKSDSRGNNDGQVENVLVLQGGGSLGAFGCGVFKAFAESNIRIDIIAGTSIGGVNAAIIAGSRDGNPEAALEQFWLELAENSVDLPAPPPVAWWLIPPNTPVKGHGHDGGGPGEALHNALAFYSSAAYGNDLMFVPRWRPDRAIKDPQYLNPKRWTYLYDHSPLAKTLDRYIDYAKLRPGGRPNSRLIVTAVNVLTAEPLTFDSSRVQITPRHLLGTSGYPLYGFPWAEVDDGLYAWDGSLLSNTPFREVIDASPVADKRVFIVENYPKAIDRLPESLPEVLHRARDIVFSDKTAHNIRMSKVITSYLRFIEQLYCLVEDYVDKSKLDSREMEKIRRKYNRIIREHGAEIKAIAYITRDEHCPHLYENTDFSPKTVRKLIYNGRAKAHEVIKATSFH